MKTVSLGAPRSSTVKFRMPTRDNLVPIRVDIEVDGQRYRDAFTWNPRDPDSEVITFAKRTAKELKLPATFVPQMLQSIQGQLAEFRSYEGQEMQVKEKIMPLKIDLRVNNTTIRDQFLWDIGNLESDPEEFARTLCDDLNITDPEVGEVSAWSATMPLVGQEDPEVASANAPPPWSVGQEGPRPWVLQVGCLCLHGTPPSSLHGRPTPIPHGPPPLPRHDHPPLHVHGRPRPCCTATLC